MLVRQQAHVVSLAAHGWESEGVQTLHQHFPELNKRFPPLPGVLLKVSSRGMPSLRPSLHTQHIKSDVSGKMPTHCSRLATSSKYYCCIFVGSCRNGHTSDHCLGNLHAALHGRNQQGFERLLHTRGRASLASHCRSAKVIILMSEARYASLP